MINIADAVNIKGHNLKGKSFTLKPVKSETTARTTNPPLPVR
jgi:hypothetical protein